MAEDVAVPPAIPGGGGDEGRDDGFDLFSSDYEGDSVSDFLRDLRHVLFYLIHRDVPDLSMPALLRRSLMDTWSEIEARLVITIRLSSRPENQSRLRGEALAGPEWRPKNTAYASARRQQNRAKAKSIRRWIRPILKIANTILGSLAQIFPIAHAIHEYKDTAEAGYEMGEMAYE